MQVLVSLCGRFGAVLVCGRFGLWPFWFVAVLDVFHAKQSENSHADYSRHCES